MAAACSFLKSASSVLFISFLFLSTGKEIRAPVMNLGFHKGRKMRNKMLKKQEDRTQFFYFRISSLLMGDDLRRESSLF